MMNKTTKKHGAVLYTRVSTGEQDKHGTSPETQRDACRAKALALSLPIVAEYYDGGISGGLLLARKEFQAALSDIREGRADTLICPTISRYSRDVEHQQAVKKAVKAAGGRLVFCDAEFEDSAAGDLNFVVQGGFAEYERKMIRERFVGGHHRRAKDAIQTARLIAPYGYIIPTHTDILRELYPAGMEGKYLIREEQAEVVRELFARYAAGGSSLTDLCRWLNREGVPTPGSARLWHISTLRYLLANPVYKGLAAYGRFDHSTDETRLMQTNPQTGRLLRTLKYRRAADPETWITWAVPALVSEETWEAVSACLRDNQRRMAGSHKQVRMLSGRVVCPHCGGSMMCSAPGRKQNADGTPRILPPRYVCTRYRQSIAHTGERECLPDSYLVPDVEQAVILALLEACQKPESIQEAIAAYARLQEAPRPATDPRREIAAIDKALHELDEQHTATVKAQIAGIRAGAEATAYNAVFADIAAERKDLEDRRGLLTRRLRETPAGQKRQEAAPNAGILLLQARQVLESPDVAGVVKRNIAGAVIEQVICRKGTEKSGRGVKAGAEIVFQPGVFGEALIFGEDDPSGRSSLQLSKQISRPILPCPVATTVA